MYNKIRQSKFITELKTYPIINEKPTIESILELRNLIGWGIYDCKMLMQRAKTTDDAIRILNWVIRDIN